MKRLKIGALLFLLAGIGFMVYVGIRGWTISSAPYSPAPAPALEGVLSVNERLTDADLIGQGKILRPEDIALDSEGRIYAGSNEYRKIYRVTPGKEPSIEVFADLQSLPVGMKFDNEGNLIVCDVPRGLVSISPDGNQTVLVSEFEGKEFGFIDDVDVAKDGRIFFSDASERFTGRNGNPGWEYEAMDSRPYGRLFVFDPKTRETKLLLKDLYFANGIAVAEDSSFVLVAETFRTRITRYWLSGPNAGRSNVFAENLPGYPDGVLGDGRGGFWVAFPSKREAALEMILPYPFIKNIVTALPKSIWLRSSKYGFIAHMDRTGNITETLHDPKGRVYSVTNVVEHNGALYLGTLTGDSIAKIQLKK